MIPPHRPAFGLGTVIASALTNGAGKSVRGLEDAFAEASGCPGAVWLPSARAGICWALKASMEAGATVFGPAFTCTAVHEAMVRSGGQPVVLDAAKVGFLMSDEEPLRSPSGPHALVLCEVYGHTYDLAQLSRTAPSPPVVRIVDMAMSVPHPTLFQRLQTNDFAVISFGAGKSMYAGWGGIGFARSSVLAQEVRRLRDSKLERGSFELWLRRTAETAARTVAQQPIFYSLAKRMRARPSSRSPGVAEPCFVGFPAEWLNDHAVTDHWRRPSTRLDRGLALWNLKRAGRFHEARLALAQRYQRNLAGAKHIVSPTSAPAGLSHYTVLVPAAIRARVQTRLSASGITAITLWDFSQHLDRQQFPNAFLLSSEVLNLPLSPWMPPGEVDRVCEVLIRCVSQEFSVSSQP